MVNRVAASTFSEFLIAPLLPGLARVLSLSSLPPVFLEELVARIRHTEDYRCLALFGCWARIGFWHFFQEVKNRALRSLSPPLEKR
jgi:hypothetical protein